MTPQQRTELIRITTLNARNDFIKYTIVQEKEILALFEHTASNIIKRIEYSTYQGVIPNARLVLLLENVTKEIRLLNPKLALKIRSQMRRSIDFGMISGIKTANAIGLGNKFNIHVGSSYIDVCGNVHRYNPTIHAYQNSRWATINGAAMDSLMKFRPSGLLFSKSVWDITYNSQKLIRNAIARTVLQGESPAKLSRLIRGFLNEPERLYRRVRTDGKLVLSKPASLYHPGMGVARSSYKNAMRLARSEMARAYHEGAIRYMKTKKWITGATWRTGSANPCLICSDMEGQFYRKDDIPMIPHPNCVCYVEYVYQEEALAKVA